MDTQITREQAAAIANCISTFRPEWHAGAVTTVIEELPGPLSTAAEHAIRVASDYRNKYPRAIIAIPMETKNNEHPKRPGAREICDICSRSEWACGQAQRNTGLDPHPYRRAVGGASVPHDVASGGRSGDELPTLGGTR